MSCECHKFVCECIHERLRAALATARLWSRRWKADAKAHRATVDECNVTITAVRAELAAANERAETLQRERDEMAAAAQKAGGALDLLYGRYESGDVCFVGGDITGSPMGNAVQLSGPEETQILEAMEAVGIETILRRQSGKRLNPSAILAARDKAQYRAGAINVLENQPCTDTDAQRGKSCIECSTALLCPRCRALAALKGGK